MKAEDLIAKAPKLPAPAPAVVKLLGLLGSPDTDNTAVARVLKQDIVLSAKVLALCNSAAYGLSSPVSSLDQALMYLGFAEIHRIVMAISFGGALSPSLTGYVIEVGALWRHSLLTALCTESVLRAAKALQVDVPVPVAYTAGLIHDIGKLVISHALDAEKQNAICTLLDQGNCSLIEAETQIIGSDHAEVGACLLRQWKLPEVLTEAVAHHHHPPTTPQPGLSAVIHAADVIAHQAGSAPGLGGFAVRPDEAALAALGFNRSHLDSLTLCAFDSLLEVEEAIAAA